MIIHTKHRNETDRWPTAGNLSAINWKSSTVTLQDIFLGDSQNKMADAIHNTADADLVAAYGATNRLLSYFRVHPVAESYEIDHHEIRKNLMENELCIRLRSGRAN